MMMTKVLIETCKVKNEKGSTMLNVQQGVNVIGIIGDWDSEMESDLHRVPRLRQWLHWHQSGQHPYFQLLLDGQVILAF